MILDIVAWAEAGEWRKDPRASQPVPEFAAARIDRGWRRVRKGGADIAGLAPEERHRLRIEIKKLRYAAEFFASLGAKERRPEQRAFIDRLEAMQESLGRLNDIETARDIAPDLLAVEEQPGEAEALIAEAQASHAALREAGRYWR